jgi:streptogramin lyase
VFGPAAEIALGSGATAEPEAVAVDGSGNVYVGGYDNSTVQEIPYGCTSSSCVAQLGGGFLDAAGVAVDGGGNVYVADVFEGVKEMPRGCASQSCMTTLGAGFGAPVGAAVDGSGNVYVADAADSAVKEMSPGCDSSTCVTTLGGGFGGPASVAVDGSGNVYIADSTDSAVKEMAPGCASAKCVRTLGGGFYQPGGVAVDGSGNVYVADSDNDAVKVMPPDCASVDCVTMLSTESYPVGVAVDGGGNVYAADYFSNGVEELNVVSPPSFIFVDSNGIGVQSGDSPMTAILRNIGNAPLRFPVPKTGENPSVAANFTLDSSTTCPEVGSRSSAGILAAGGSCELAVDFIPQDNGTIAGAVVLTDNNLNVSDARQSIGLSGSSDSAQTNP